HRAAAGDRRRSPSRDAGALAGRRFRAGARSQHATSHRRLHAVHARRVPRARRAPRVVRLLRDTGHARVSVRLRARSRELTPRADRRRSAVRPARRLFRRLRARARLHAPRALRLRSLLTVSRMTGPGACRAVLEAALAEPARLDLAARQTLAAAGEPTLEATLRDFAAAHGAAALPVLTALAADEAARGARRAAKRALYRLAQHGVTAPAPPARRPVIERQPERPVR